MLAHDALDVNTQGSQPSASQNPHQLRDATGRESRDGSGLEEVCLVDHARGRYLVCGSHAYSLNNPSRRPENTSYWRCVGYKKGRGCGGRAKVVGDLHGPVDDLWVEATPAEKHTCTATGLGKILLDKMCRKAQELRVNQPAWDAFRDVVPECSDAQLQQLPSKSGIYQKLNKEKRRALGLPNPPRSLTGFALPPEFCSTKVGGKAVDMLLWDSGSTDDERVLIFWDQCTLQRLLSNNNVLHICLDATFSVCPLRFAEQVTLLVQHPCGRFLPIFYCVAPNRSVLTYIKILQRIVPKIGGPSRVASTMSDMEPALLSAIRTVLPLSSITVCYFHWTQAVFRKFRRVFPFMCYNNAHKDPKVREAYETFYTVACVPFLPVSLTAVAFEAAIGGLPRRERNILSGYLHRKYGLGKQVGPAVLNLRARVMSSRGRTNNAQEGFHMGWGRRFAKTSRPHLWIWVDAVRRIISEVYADAVMYDRGDAWYRKPEYVALDARLQILCGRPVDEPDLHEWFKLARGVVRGAVKHAAQCNDDDVDINSDDDDDNDNGSAEQECGHGDDIKPSQSSSTQAVGDHSSCPGKRQRVANIRSDVTSDSRARVSADDQPPQPSVHSDAGLSSSVVDLFHKTANHRSQPSPSASTGKVEGPSRGSVPQRPTPNSQCSAEDPNGSTEEPNASTEELDGSTECRPPSSTASPNWLVHDTLLGEFRLTMQDRHDLASPCTEISDMAVGTWMALLCTRCLCLLQFPPITPASLEVMKTQLEGIPKAPSLGNAPLIIQPLYDHRAKHFALAVRNHEGLVLYLDSSLGMNAIPGPMREVMTAMFGKGTKCVCLRTQQQTPGSANCGLFTVAWATEYALQRAAVDPEKATYDEEKMRDHAVRCLQEKRLKPFPRKRGRPGRNNRLQSRMDIEL